MIRKLFIAVFLVLVVVGGLGAVKMLQFKSLMAAGQTFAPPPESVSSAPVQEAKWQETLAAIGSITAAQGVTVSPSIAGTVHEIAFESGAVVARGDLLVRLNTSTEEAQLRALEAQEELARLNLARDRSLRDQNMISQSQLDATESTLKQTQGNADAVRAIIAKKTIRAPFAGHLGLRLVNLGQYLDTGKPIVSLQSLTPVYADFSLPQQELARLKTGMSVRVTTDAYPGRQFDGTLAAINPDLDPQTRSVGLRGAFDNLDQSLRPGMFVRVEVLLPEEQPVLAIPATSILSAPYGDSVYIIEPGPGNTNRQPQLVVRQQFVRVGRARGDFVSVESGLKPGERVVSSGIFKLRNGMSVIENNDLAPTSDLAPRPSDS